MSTADARVKAVADTSVLIPFINEGVSYQFLELQAGRPVLYLSSVVMGELYSGAFDAKTVRLLDDMFDTFHGVGRLLVPSASDWQRAGKVVAKLGRKYGFEGRFLARLQNDVLIALSARQVGAFVVTENLKDFLRIREFVDFRVFGDG